MIYKKGPAYFSQPEYRDIRHMLQTLAQDHGSEPAYAYRLKPREATLYKSYAQLLADVQAFGTACLSLKLCTSGDSIAILGENSYAWAVAHTAVLCGLGRSVPLDKQLALPEVQSLCQRSRATVLCIDQAHANLVEPVLESCPLIHSVIWLHAPESPMEPQEDPRFFTFGQLLQSGATSLEKGETVYTQAPIDPNEGLGLFFTSGTTSASKGVLLSHKNILSNFRNGLRVLYCKPGSRCLSILPIHHTFENTVGMYAQLSVHNCIYFNDGLRYFLYNMKDWKIEVILAVPLLLENIYKQMQSGIAKSGKTRSFQLARNLSSILRKLGIDLRRKLFAALLNELGGSLKLIIAGAAALSPEVLDFLDAIGIECMLGYGLTESGPMIAANTQRNWKLGSVGLPLADHEVRIDNGLDYSDADHPGEILARTDSIMVGYYEDPEATAEAIDPEGWLHTGDIGYLDSEGYLFLTGRKKSMIVLTNGKKVFPEELESLLTQIPGVQAAYVWGENNNREHVDTCASLLIDRTKLPESLQEGADDVIGSWLNSQISEQNTKIPPYKAIKYFLWSDSGMPMTTTLKVRRNLEDQRIHGFLQSRDWTMREANQQRLML